MLSWLEDTEDLFNHLRPVSVDRETLHEQLQAHRVVTSDIDNHRVQVDNVSEQADSNPALQPKVEDMLDRYDNLLTHAQRRGEELDEVNKHFSHSLPVELSGGG